MTLVTAWMGEKMPESEELVTYPESFDIRGLVDEFEVASNLKIWKRQILSVVIRWKSLSIKSSRIFPKTK
jgi:hypothetical protein